MDSVYDAALKRGEELKAELAKLQTYLELHEHFRDRFGLTPTAAPSPDPAEVDAPVVDQAAATHEIHVQEPGALEAPEPEPAVQAPDVEPAALDAAVHAEETAAAATSEEAPRVIQASEGVLGPAVSEPDLHSPLGPEATLQSVAEKLAATISASHPSVTGYTV